MEEKQRYYYDGLGEDIFDSEIDDYPSNQTICDTLNQQNNKIKEFEDFMKEEEFTSLEDLKAYIKLQSNGSKNLIQENQQLKEQVKELEQSIENLQKLNGETIILNRTVTKDSQILEKENEQLKQSLEYANKQLDYFTNKFRSREFKRTGDWAKDIELHMKQLVISELEKVKSLLEKESKKNPIVYDINNDLVGGAIDRNTCFSIIDNQIKELKGEK